MGFQPTPNGWAAGIIYEMDGVPCQNTLHYSKVGGNATTAQAFCNQLVAAWEADVMPFLSSSLVLNSVILAGIETASDPVVFSPPAGTGAGGEGGACLPNETAFCVSLHTALRGRSFRGRLFIPGVPELAREGINRVTALFATNLRIGIGNAIFTGIGDNWIPAILSRRAGGVLRPTGHLEAVTDVTITDNILDSMRRRKPRL